MKKRISHYLLLLVMVIVVNFFLPRMMPGSPVKTLIGEDAGSLTAAEKMGILESYDLDKPLYQQFGIYLKDLFTLNWGNSYAKRQPILTLIGNRAGWTLLLAGSNLLILTLLGTWLGISGAARRRKGKGAGLLIASAGISSLPPFWVAMILLSVFGVHLGWFPLYGAYDMWSKKHGFALILDVLHHLFLPLLTMVITEFMTFFTTARYGAIQVMAEDYIRMARMRGIPERQIKKRYILRNTMIPVFTMIMLDAGYLLSGSVLIETVFSYPGLGTLMQEAVQARDYPLIQYTFLVSAVMTIAALFLADILNRRVDPRSEGDFHE